MTDRKQIGGLTRRRLLQGAAGAVGLAAVSGVGAACGDSSADTAVSSADTAVSKTSGAVKRGGHLIWGVSEGTTLETLNPYTPTYTSDIVRALNVYETLLTYDANLGVKMRLAESFEVNAAATEYTVRLRPGITFHNGKSLTADDVIYSIRRMLDPKAGAFERALILSIDGKGLKKLDNRTLRIPLKRPNAFLAANFAYFPSAIVADGTTDFSKPNGTGPFKFKSWQVGKSLSLKANSNYWIHGQPYADAVTLVAIPDDSARISALISKQVHMVDGVNYARAATLRSTPGVTLINRESNSFPPFTMACDIKPFDDVRVRKAMRLIAGRPQLVESALSGFGTVANDLPGQGSPLYASTMPQRVQDIEQAKSLLRQAGHSGLTVTLNSSNEWPGMQQSAVAFAQQATAAGVKVQINAIPADSYYGSSYLHYAFAQSGWTAQPLTTFYQNAFLKDSPYNETHWFRPAWEKIYHEALATTNPTKQKEMFFELQKELWDEGGYIQWGNQNVVDATVSNLRGLSDSGGGPLGYYDLRTMWLA